MPYVPIIAPADLGTLLYPEVIAEITRNDGGTLAANAIALAIGEAKIYLTRYDLVQLFGDPVAGTSATFSDPFLTNLVKQIALWQLVKLGNASIQYDHARNLYEEAVKTFKAIQQGTADPRWPYFDTSTEDPLPGDSVTIQAMPKRTNYY